MSRNSPFSFLNSHFSSGGFTFIEVVLVLGILLTVFALVLPVTRQFAVSASVHDEALALATDLRRAQASALAGIGDGPSGVRLDADPVNTWANFQGATYVPGAPGVETHTIRGEVTLASVSLAGGGNEVVFTELRGTTAQAGAVTLHARGGETRTVTVNAHGNVDVQ